MEKEMNCEDCGTPFTYTVPTNYPDRRKYCSPCSIAKKAQWEDKKTTTPEGKDAYDKYAIKERPNEIMKNQAVTLAMPITDSEKVVEYADKKMDWRGENVQPKANLMSQKDIMIISQCLTKAWASGTAQVIDPKDILDAYRFFVLELEQNG